MVIGYDGLMALHSHSGLERQLAFPKDKVLVDVRFRDRFSGECADDFDYGGVKYIKVNILDFIRHGGVFKNYKS